MWFWALYVVDSVVLGSVCDGYCGSRLIMLLILRFLALSVVDIGVLCSIDIVVLGLICGGY